MTNQQSVAQVGLPKKLLSLDGGGVRGISSLMVLQAIMREVQRIEDGEPAVTDHTKPGISVTTVAKTKERKPSDYFDLTGGTSTGGIIALMLGRLNMDCTQAIDVYKNLSEEIFAIRLGGWNISKNPVLSKILGSAVLGLRTLFGTQFDATHMDKGINDILSDPARNPDKNKMLIQDKFNDPSARGKMLLCATMADRGKAILFRDYVPPSDAIPESGQQGNQDSSAPSDLVAPPYFHPGEVTNPTDPTQVSLNSFRYDKVTIQQAVRATSAAPTYLPAEPIQGIDFWDGGCLNNNPIDQIWAARYDLAPTPFIEPYVSVVVSLGTTYSDEDSKPKRPSGMIKRLMGILGKSLNFMTNTEAKHKDFKRNIYRRNLRQPETQRTEYFRLNAPTYNRKVDLADYKAIGFLEDMTRKYLADPKVQKDVTRIAKLLVKQKAATQAST